MSAADLTGLVARAEAVLARVEALLPPVASDPDWRSVTAARAQVLYVDRDELAGVEGLGLVVSPGVLGLGLGVEDAGVVGEGEGPAPEPSSLRPEGRVPVPSGTEWVPLL